MTKADQENCRSVVRMQARVLLEELAARAAEQLAAADAQLAAIYDRQDDAWKEVHAEAKRVVDAADAAVAKRCRELGIPEDFRPGLSLGWYGRGENASKERRAELRKVAQSRVEAGKRRAAVAVHKWEAAALARLATGALESDAARDFLAGLPTAEALLPMLDVKALDAALPIEGRREDC
jgi:hypothetical protein